MWSAELESINKTSFYRHDLYFILESTIDKILSLKTCHHYLISLYLAWWLRSKKKYGKLVVNNEHVYIKRAVLPPVETIHYAYVGKTALNQLKATIPTFLYVYSCHKQNKLNINTAINLDHLSLIIEHRPDAKPLNYYLQSPIDQSDKLIIYLQIINALNLAYLQYGFVHDDLNSAISVEYVNPLRSIRIYTSDSIQYVYTNYVVYIGNFDKSQIQQKVYNCCQIVDLLTVFNLTHLKSGPLRLDLHVDYLCQQVPLYKSALSHINDQLVNSKANYVLAYAPPLDPDESTIEKYILYMLKLRYFKELLQDASIELFYKAQLFVLYEHVSGKYYPLIRLLR